MERDLSVPHHVKALERFLNISRLLSEVENVMVDPIPTFKYSWNVNDENTSNPDSLLLDRDLKPDEKFMYDTSELTEENMWLKDILLSDSSDSSDEEEMSEEEMKRMLKKHKQMKKIREKTRQQSGTYSGYSTSILASDNPAFHFEFPSLDYSNKTRREKRPVCRKRPSKEGEPLTISDMIDALHSHCVSEETGITPPQLLIECDGPCLKKPRYSRTTSQIWREAIGQVVKKAEERLSRLDQQQSSTSMLCDEIKLKSEDLLQNLKHTNTLNQADRVSSNSEKQFEEAKVPTPDADGDLNLEKKSQELQASVKIESDLNALDNINSSSKVVEIENVEQVNDNSIESNGKSSR